MNQSIYKKAIGILKKVYHHTNTDYESDYNGEIGYKTGFLTRQQQQLLEAVNLVPNNFEQFTHDSLIKEFLEIKKSGVINLDFCTAMFIKGLSGDFPRYRQPLMSFWWLQSLFEHPYEISNSSANCLQCGLPQSVTLDRTHSLFTYHLGHSWNEMPANFLADLQEISNFPAPSINESDSQRLTDLLIEINKADEDETPGRLEKRIAQSKLLPKTDKYKRYGILQTLAVVGVLPTDSSHNKQPSRSDIVPPLAGWKGEFGVDFDRASKIFTWSPMSR